MSRPVYLVFTLMCGVMICFISTGSAQPNNPKVELVSCEQANLGTVSLGVREKEGRFVDNLRAEDLALTLNRVPAQILKLEANANQPLSVVILIDTSMSQQFTLGHTKLAALKFVEWILRTKNDNAAVVTFSGEAVVEEELTNDSTRLLRAISRVELDRPPDYSLGGVGGSRSPPIRPSRQGTTAVWDAVWASAEGVLKPVKGTRRVIMLLTSGEDYSSRTRLQETIEHASSLDVSVFSIGTVDKGYYLIGRHVLTELSEDTGGRAFFLKKVQDLPDIFAKIEQELRSHYVLTYCAAQQKSASSPGQIRIEIRNAQLRKADPRLSYRRYSF